MEYEVRFYFSRKRIDDILKKLQSFSSLKQLERNYEKTIQYDHPNKELSFYQKEIDGRFRIRITKNDLISKCKISWKKRVNETRTTLVNKEEEVEISIDYTEYDNLMFIINNVLKMKEIESYERYRTLFVNEDIEISIDEYPFALALEIENKSKNKNPEEIVKYWVKMLELDINKAYRLSFDDKYAELCREQNKKQYNNITFDLDMPDVIE